MRRVIYTIVSAIACASAANAAQDADPAAEETSEAGQTLPTSEAEPNEGDIAADLNSQQQIRQTFTVTRSVNGTVVETTTREVAADMLDASRATEAGQTLAEAVRASFDRELLTRTEAYEEAKLDFALGDVDLNKQLNEEEFLRLVDLLQAEIEENAPTPVGTIAPRDAFIADLDADNARTIFQNMAGEAMALDERGFILGFLGEFDRADVNADGLLTGPELDDFRRAIGAWSGAS